MKRIATVVSLTTAVLLLILLLGILSSQTVRAAVSTLVTVVNTSANPVLTKNVAQPGTFPYQQTVLFNQNTSTCTNFVCTVSFNAVPTGYRLVITSASAFYKLGNGNAGGTVPNVALGINGGFGILHQLPAPQPIGFNIYVASSPINLYVEAGQTPTLFLGGQFVTTDDSNSAQATVVGYLIPTT